MEAGIKAGNLWNVGHPFPYAVDRRQIVGLMQGGERDQFIQLYKNVALDEDGPIVLCATVNDAMTDPYEAGLAVFDTQP